MKKIIKIVVLVLVGLFIISQIVEFVDDIQREKKQAEQAANYDRSKSIGYQVVKNAMDAYNQEEIEPGDDAEPVFDETYTDGNGTEWVFSRKGEKGIQLTIKGKQKSYYLEKITTGVYNVFRSDRYVDEGYRLRMIDDGHSIEVTKDNKTTVFTVGG